MTLKRGKPEPLTEDQQKLVDQQIAEAKLAISDDVDMQIVQKLDSYKEKVSDIESRTFAGGKIYVERDQDEFTDEPIVLTVGSLIEYLSNYDRNLGIIVGNANCQDCGNEPAEGIIIRQNQILITSHIPKISDIDPVDYDSCPNCDWIGSAEHLPDQFCKKCHKCVECGKIKEKCLCEGKIKDGDFE